MGYHMKKVVKNGGDVKSRMRCVLAGELIITISF
jgi:hypothetical protein